MLSLHRLILLIFAATATAAAAEEGLPPYLKAQQGLYKSYVPEALLLLEDETEKRLMTAISDDSNQFALLACLGYVSKIHNTISGHTKRPDGSTGLLHTDSGWSTAQRHMRMIKSFETKIDHISRCIFVFAGYTGWPGLNNTCVVLTDANYYVIDWRGNQQVDTLKECSFENGVLKILCERRQGGLSTYSYDIARNSISQRNVVEVTQALKN